MLCMHNSMLQRLFFLRRSVDEKKCYLIALFPRVSARFSRYRSASIIFHLFFYAKKVVQILMNTTPRTVERSSFLRSFTRAPTQRLQQFNCKLSFGFLIKFFLLPRIVLIKLPSEIFIITKLPSFLCNSSRNHCLVGWCELRKKL